MEKVSVIVSVYNTQKYLRECLDSLVNQTYKNIEIVIIDDGSTDASLEICKKYQEKYGQIVLFHKKNGGVSDTRNYGIKYATGQYVSFVDSDDYLEKDAINKLVKLLKKYDADISLCLRVGHKLENNEVRVTNGQAMLMHILNNSCFEVWGKLYKKELFFDDVFPVGKIHEDLYAIPKVFLRSERCVIIHKGLYNYRLRSDGIMGVAVKNNLKDIVCCCVDNVINSEKRNINKKFFDEFQKWFFYHILWYFYEIVCNMKKEKSKLSLKNVAYFYKKTFNIFWVNPCVKISDRFRFTFIAIIPQIVRDYSVFKYKLNKKKDKNIT